MRQDLAPLSLARRLGLGAAVLAVVVSLVLGTSAWAYYRQASARDHLVDVVDKARLAAQTLLSDYVNQESGVRGYILTSQTSFLQPWYQGLVAAKADRAQLGHLEANDPTSDVLLAGVDRAAARWQRQFADPAVAATRRGSRAYDSTSALDQGKRDFDSLRRRFAALDNALDRSQAASQAALAHNQDLVEALFTALVLALLLAAILSAWALRSWVTRPIRLLRSDVRAVAGGSLDHEVSSTGPPDLADLAADVEAMRERIVAQVRSLVSARDDLTDVNTELTRSNQELEQFAYVASHDLQEPLRKVVSFCQLLSERYEQQLDDRGRQYIAFAVDGATRMQSLINDLLAFSRVGRTTAAFGDVDLEVAAGNALGNLDTAIKENAAVVTVGPLPVVKGDLALLTALFQNLIGNAIKFNKSGLPVVKVSARRDGDQWEVAVEDNGIGIEARFADRIFVIFQRLHGRSEYSGSGIGLALCKKIVEFHSGHISLDTSYSPGARILVSLPAHAPSR